MLQHSFHDLSSEYISILLTRHLTSWNQIRYIEYAHENFMHIFIEKEYKQVKDPSNKLDKRITVSVSQKLFDQLDFWVDHSDTNKSILLRNLIANWIMSRMYTGDEAAQRLVKSSYIDEDIAIRRIFK